MTQFSIIEQDVQEFSAFIKNFSSQLLQLVALEHTRQCSIASEHLVQVFRSFKKFPYSQVLHILPLRQVTHLSIIEQEEQVFSLFTKNIC